MKTKIIFLAALFLCVETSGFSQDVLMVPFAADELRVVPLFNSCSYYFHTSGEAAIRAEYKGTKETDWRAAHATVCDQPEKIHKGSLFDLVEDSEYQLRIFSGDKVVAQTVFRTWSSNPRIGKTIDLGTLPETARDGIVITGQGTPEAWIKYTAPPGWVVRRTSRDGEKQDAVIVLKGAKYVILENLVVEGGRRYGIFVDDCDSIRILNCEISGWGRLGVQQFDDSERVGQYRDENGRVINYDGAVQIRKSVRTVVERCYVHDPRSRSNAWIFSHPTGPQAVVVDNTRGENVLRWNDFVGSDEHRWNDVIECLSNSSPTGGFYRDSDVTGNFLAFGNDDGVELEGGGINVRFLGNKVEGVLCGISFGACMVGPQYALGNLIVNLGDEEGYAPTFLKNGHGVEQKGKRFVYNNTFHGFGRGSTAYGGYGNATPPDAGLGTMRNNIFVCADSRPSGEWLRAEHFDNDLFWVNRTDQEAQQFVDGFRQYGQEKNGLAAEPKFVDPAKGDYRLSPDSIAHGKAVEVAGVTRTGDQLGAFFGGVTDIPWRPFTLTAEPAQVDFPATGGKAEVTVRLPGDASGPVAFRIRKNNVFDWFTVTPGHGTVTPGKTLKLTVTVDPAKLVGQPVFRGAFLVRNSSGLSRPVSVYAKGNYTVDKRPASAGPNTVYLNAESGAVDTSIDIPRDGVYSLLVRLPADSSRNARRGFEITLDGETAKSTADSGFWYLRGDVERVVWLYSFGKLEAGTKRLAVKPANRKVTGVEYIVTDNPTAFFSKGNGHRNVRHAI